VAVVLYTAVTVALYCGCCTILLWLLLWLCTVHFTAVAVVLYTAVTVALYCGCCTILMWLLHYPAVDVALYCCGSWPVFCRGCCTILLWLLHYTAVSMHCTLYCCDCCPVYWRDCCTILLWKLRNQFRGCCLKCVASVYILRQCQFNAYFCFELRQPIELQVYGLQCAATACTARILNQAWRRLRDSWNRVLGSLNVSEFGLRRAGLTTLFLFQ
jgi:hypothetical protein